MAEPMTFETYSLQQARQLLNYKWDKFPADVIPSWIADMDYPAAPPIREFVTNLGRTGNLGYAAESVAKKLPAIFCERMRDRYRWSPDPDEIVLMTDIVQGIYVTLRALCEDTGKVIVSTPGYHPILTACEELGIPMIDAPLNPNYGEPQGEWSVDFHALSAAIDADTRLLLLVNPHNPTGRVFTRHELVQFARLAAEHDLWVLADEVHCDLIYGDGGHHIPFASLDAETGSRTITFNSATKSHNLGGVRCCLAHFGSMELRQKFQAFPERFLGGGNALGYMTTTIAWEQCDDWLVQALRYLEQNRDFLVDFLCAELPAISHIKNQATYLAWLDCSAYDYASDLADYLLQEARVACYSGAVFGPQGRGCLRLNFATSREILEEKLMRIRDALNKLPGG